MQIPTDLQPWVTKVEQNTYGNRVIQNIENERRIDPPTEKEFWKRIRARASRTKSNDPKRYITLIDDAVAGGTGVGKKPDLFLKGGEAIHAETILGRFERVSVRHLGKARSQTMGLHEGNEIGLAIAIGHTKFSKLDMGKPGKVAWASFSVDIDPGIQGIKKTLESLGILLPQKPPPYVYWRYELKGDQKTFCPTVLDAGSHEFFEPSDPRAPTGNTRPVDENIDSVREVVHRSAEVDIVSQKIHIYEQP